MFWLISLHKGKFHSTFWNFTLLLDWHFFLQYGKTSTWWRLLSGACLAFVQGNVYIDGKQMMEDHCINCGNLFEKRKKGFKRKSIDSSTKTSVTVSFRDILESTLDVPITPEKNLFVWCMCFCVPKSSELFNWNYFCCQWIAIQKIPIVISREEEEEDFSSNFNPKQQGRFQVATLVLL